MGLRRQWFGIFYNLQTASILIQYLNVIIVREQSDLVKQTESVFPVRNQPYHTNKRREQKREIAVLRNSALDSSCC